MPRCLTCSYELVFLEERLRYKCAKCGRAFLQKFIENQAFRVWNDQLRSFGMRELMSEIGRMEEEKQKKRELIEFNKINRALRLLFAGPPRKRVSVTPEERKIREREHSQKWRENNPEKVKITKKRYFEDHRPQTYAYLKAWRMSNLGKSRLKQRANPLEKKTGQNGPRNARIHSQHGLNETSQPTRSR